MIAGHATSQPAAGALAPVLAPPMATIEAANAPAPAPGQGLSRRAFPALLATAVCLPLLVMLASARLEWVHAWRQAREETLRTADAAAEYAGRVLDGHRMLVQRIDDLLRGYSDGDIQRNERALHTEMTRMLEGLSLGLSSYVLDRSGRALLSATFYPAPREPVLSDREFFVALNSTNPPPTHVSKVFSGRVNGAVFFAVSRRRSNPANGLPPEAFDGLVNVSVYPKELAAGLGQLLADSRDLITLVRTDGEVLANTRGFAAPPPPLPPQSEVLRAMARAERRTSLVAGGQDGGQDGAQGPEPERLVSLRQVAGWPVYAVASRPRAEIIANWQAQMSPQLAVAVPASALLMLLATVVWRQQGALRQSYRVLEDRVAERTAAVVASEAEFRAIFDSRIIGKAQADLESLRLTRVNARFCEITGRAASDLTQHASLPDLWPPAERAAEEARFLTAIATIGHHESEFCIRHTAERPVWVMASYGLIRDGSGRPLRIVMAVQDISDRKHAEERQGLLAREVDHRAKNALAVVQAALRLTPKEDAASFAAAIEGRVGALARAQTLLARTHWHGTLLRTLVEGELALFMTAGGEAPRVLLLGPPTLIPALLTQPLSMALHELATNAAKHGALSVPGGRLAIGWQVGDGLLRLDWRERGGPAVEGPPGRGGFGSRLLGATIRQQLGGSVEQHWLPDGLHCVLEVPLQRAGAEQVDV